MPCRCRFHRVIWRVAEKLKFDRSSLPGTWKCRVGRTSYSHMRASYGKGDSKLQPSSLSSSSSPCIVHIVFSPVFDYRRSLSSRDQKGILDLVSRWKRHLTCLSHRINRLVHGGWEPVIIGNGVPSLSLTTHARPTATPGLPIPTSFPHQPLPPQMLGCDCYSPNVCVLQPKKSILVQAVNKKQKRKIFPSVVTYLYCTLFASTVFF